MAVGERSVVGCGLVGGAAGVRVRVWGEFVRESEQGMGGETRGSSAAAAGASLEAASAGAASEESASDSSGNSSGAQPERSSTRCPARKMM